MMGIPYKFDQRVQINYHLEDIGWNFVSFFVIKSFST